MMKWHGLYQSVSHSVTAEVPEYGLPLRPAPLQHIRGSASGKLSFSPRLFRSPSLLHRLLSQLYKLSLFSLLFPHLQLWLSEKGGKEGKHAKRCGIFLSFLAPMAIRHKALCPFLRTFFSSPLQIFPLKLPSSNSS